MDIILQVWTYFAQNVLTQPAYFIGLIVFLGYALLKRPLYESFAGFIKATVGYLILQVGAGGLVVNFRPILVGLKDRFNLSAVVIDPYFGQNAVTAGLPEVFGRTFTQVMVLLLIAFVFNIILVIFKKYTKVRSVFTTGHIQVQQASIAFWIVLFAFPQLGDTEVLLLMGVLLGTYWAVGSNITIEMTQELTEGGGFCVGHQQMFGIALFSKLASKMKKEGDKRLEDMTFPGFLSIFNENVVATSVLMLLFFGIILVVLGQEFLVANKFLAEGRSFFFYIMTTSLNFAVYLAILQLGVRMFVAELTQSFQGISTRLLPGAVPGIDCAATYTFGSPNAVTLGFLFGALGQFVAILTLIVLKSPVLIIAGFVPVFFDNATLAVFANNKGGVKAAIILTFCAGLIQVFGSAFIVEFIGLAPYGGYLGMFDWATLWPVMTIGMKYLSYFGLAISILGLLAVPQIQYYLNKDTYFLVTEDYDAYVALKAAKAKK
jgi:ascorbate PTS system EIIC component